MRKRIPAGTGMSQYQNAEYVLNGKSDVAEDTEVVYEEEPEEEESGMDLGALMDEILDDGEEVELAEEND